MLHIVAFLALGRIQIAMGFKPSNDLHTAQVRVEEADSVPRDDKPDVTDKASPTPPKVDSLVEEIDVLAKLPEQEIDMKPQINRAEIAMALETPASSGNPEGVKIDPVAGLNLGSDLPDIGRSPEAPLSLAAEGQMTIDPGKAIATDDSIDKFTESIIKKGANGKVDNGTLDGVVTLDDMIGLPADVLVGKKTMLPGDLLFEYNSADLRESARVGLMKLALLISNNPNLYCWIEGYTDLYGGEAFNQDLSLRRADSVRRYLTSVLHLPGEKIVSRGFGKSVPLVREGTADEQAPNRRVEIKLRKNAPPAMPAVAQQPPASDLPPPPKAVLHTPETPPPAAKPVVEQPPAKNPVLVKPARAIEVEEVPEKAVANTPPPPKAKPLPEEPPKAKPIEEDTPPPKAQEITPKPPKAVDLGE
jgi:outer membrane protein OmpA-like peptidoglycan-associated protein